MTENEKLLLATQVNTAAIMATDRFVKEKLRELHDKVADLGEEIIRLEDRVFDLAAESSDS